MEIHDRVQPYILRVVFGKFTITSWDNVGAMLSHVLPWLRAEYLADETIWDYPRGERIKMQKALPKATSCGPDFGEQDEFETIRPQEAEKFLPKAQRFTNMRKSSNPADTAYSASHNFIKKSCLEKIHNNAPFPVDL
jgi:hypothetical protein